MFCHACALFKGFSGIFIQHYQHVLNKIQYRYFYHNLIDTAIFVYDKTCLWNPLAWNSICNRSNYCTTLLQVWRYIGHFITKLEWLTACLGCFVICLILMPHETFILVQSRAKHMKIFINCSNCVKMNDFSTNRILCILCTDCCWFL